MAWSKTEKQLCWHQEPRKADVRSITSLCGKALLAVMSHGPVCSNLVAKEDSHSTASESSSSCCSWSTASPRDHRPTWQENWLDWIFKDFSFGDKKEKAGFNVATGPANTQVQELTALICGCISTASSQPGLCSYTIKEVWGKIM